MIAHDAHAGKQPVICGDWHIYNVSVTVPVLNEYCRSLASTFHPAAWALDCREQPAQRGNGETR
jgi:hypothetical protein